MGQILSLVDLVLQIKVLMGEQVLLVLMPLEAVEEVLVQLEEVFQQTNNQVEMEAQE